MNRNFFLCFLLAGALIFFAGVSAAQAQERMPQSVMINGVQSQAVTLLQNGIIQIPICATPQPYTSLDQQSSGWACYDQSTGVWLLNALPPQRPLGL